MAMFPFKFRNLGDDHRFLASILINSSNGISVLLSVHLTYWARECRNSQTASWKNKETSGLFFPANKAIPSTSSHVAMSVNKISHTNRLGEEVIRNESLWNNLQVVSQEGISEGRIACLSVYCSLPSDSGNLLQVCAHWWDRCSGVGSELIFLQDFYFIGKNTSLHQQECTFHSHHLFLHWSKRVVFKHSMHAFAACMPFLNRAHGFFTSRDFL